MTTINAIAFDDSVMMFSDTAVYDVDTVVTRFHTKQGVAIGHPWGFMTSGRMDVREKVGAAFARMAMDSALDDLPAFSRDLLAEYEGETSLPPHFLIVLAGWSDRAQKWAVFTIASGLVPEERRFVVSPPMASFLRARACVGGNLRQWTEQRMRRDIDRLGPLEYAFQQMAIQRLDEDSELPVGDQMTGRVGGGLDATIVSAGGFHRFDLGSFPDRVGDSLVSATTNAARATFPDLRLSRSGVTPSRRDRRRVARAA